MKIHSDRSVEIRGIFNGLCVAALAVACWLTAAKPLAAAEAQWIWAPAHHGVEAPSGSCFFRKMFSGDNATGGKIEITCDESYLLYVNGLKIGSGENWKSLDSYDIGAYLTPGQNVIAIAATKSQAGPPGLVARVAITRSGGQIDNLSTDATWRVGLEKQAGWSQPSYDDSLWRPARSLGLLGMAAPWGNKVQAATPHDQARFRVTREFRVEWIVPPAKTGSLLTMAFNEFGNILASRENGPLLLIRDSKGDGLPDTVTTYCDKVKNCQGILALNGDVFVTADGPEGAGLYRLSDSQHTGKIDSVRLLIKFVGHMEEHGPHAVSLGPDGLIYVLCGNLTKLAKPVQSGGPYRNSYEGDLIQPRYEDPRGFAMGVKAPGGMILRTDIDGSFVHYFAGGLRNAYGMAFHPDGELITHDADMESDEGLPWYRPTRVCHVVPGAEFGWRSGWAKWPDYYVDNLPPILDTGPGSPTAMVVYDHFMYPVRYHKSMFVGDWSQGQIVNISLQSDGATYTARSSVFIEGNPLNVTGMDVGPDGWLYFCTGGRGTEGGIYRVVWTGTVPPEVTQLGTGINAALKQPQFYSAFGRQRIATIKKELGATWDREVSQTIVDRTLSTDMRVRALDVMQLFGPFPKSEQLLDLSRDRDSQIRAKVALLMGLHAEDRLTSRLVEMLADPHPLVQRQACDALVRCGAQPSADAVLPLLGSPDRYVAFAARRLVEQIPRDRWQKGVLEASRPRVFLVGCVALLGTGPDRDTCQKVLDRCQELMKGFLSDSDFLDLLRVCELAMIQGNYKTGELTGLARVMAAEYPAGELRMNRELVRILAALDESSVADRYLQQLHSNIDLTEKMQLAMHASHFVAGWNSQQRLSMLEFYEQVRTTPRGVPFGRYLDRVTRDFVAGMTDDERRSVLANGARWPGAALGAIAHLPQDLDPAMVDSLAQLDRNLVKDKSEAAQRLRIGIVAVLARCGSPAAMAYLREAFDREPERRGIVAMGLAQQPDGENWPVLIRALPVLQGSIAAEVLAQLSHVDRKPDKPEPIRQVILQGLSAPDDDGRKASLALLAKWTAHDEGNSEDPPSQRLAAWQKWFAATYPNEPVAALPKAGAGDKYTIAQLEKFLSSSDAASGDRVRGAAIYVRARCAACHRFGQQGTPLGPDLTTVTRRFQRKEILESILFPSQVISDQYATKTITTKEGRSLSGLVSPDPDGGLMVLDASGQRTRVAQDRVEQMVTSKVSMMPEGLLNPLSLSEIADLFAYLNAPQPQYLTRKPGQSPPSSR